jgi:hypothetical protein
MKLGTAPQINDRKKETNAKIIVVTERDIYGSLLPHSFPRKTAIKPNGGSSVPSYFICRIAV